jgi:hypothetical protein
VTNPLNVGFPTNGVFSRSDFDNVQLNNGNLHFEIPLWSDTGRGLAVSFKFVYDNKGWAFRETCDKYGICTEGDGKEVLQFGLHERNAVLDRYVERPNGRKRRWRQQHGGVHFLQWQASRASRCLKLAVHYYFSDRPGSASVITDSLGNVEKEVEYYPNLACLNQSKAHSRSKRL